MIRYFYGEDTFAAREAITALGNQEQAQVRFLDAEELDERTFREQLTAGAGLFGKQLVVVRDPSQLPKAFQEIAVSAAEAESHTLVVLWDQEEPRESSAVFAYFRKGARVFPDPPVSELARWLVSEAQKRGVVLKQDAAASLIARLGSDRWRLLSELERLSLTGEEVTRGWVEAEVDSLRSEGEIFEFLRALTLPNGKTGGRVAAMREFQALLESGASELYIVSMLAYQFRTLYLLSRGKTQGISPGAARALSPVARRRPAAAWLNDLTRVVATDFAIKQGKTDMRTGVTMLILGLVQRV